LPLFDDVLIDTEMIVEPLSTTRVIAVTIGVAVEKRLPSPNLHQIHCLGEILGDSCPQNLNSAKANLRPVFCFMVQVAFCVGRKIERLKTQNSMNPVIKNLMPAVVALFLGLSGQLHATLVTVDSNISSGFMAVFALDDVGGPDYSAFQFQGNWALPDVKSTVRTSSIVLEANYNTYVDNPNPPGSLFWRDNGGLGLGGNKWMVASTFAGVSASSFLDNNCNFKAEVSNFTFAEGYTVRAFIKGFDANYAKNFQLFSDPLSQGSEVDLNFDTLGWVNIQYGFEVQGINANPANPPGSATVIANVVPPIVYGIPNADFEIPDGVSWAFDQENGHTVSYPAEGGNPGGFAEINATAATQPYYGLLVSNGRLQIPLEALSLVPGRTYVFAMDMKIVQGANLGGFKVDFLPGDPANPTSPTHTTGDMYPGITGDGSEWATYSFPVTIPATATGVKLVPLWGVASTVAYDNVRLAGPFAASAVVTASNVKIKWPTVTGRSYRVRKSPDLVNWTSFGALMNGNGATFSVTDPVGSPGKAFFQVVETGP
jgi:hypothetical protein